MNTLSGMTGLGGGVLTLIYHLLCLPVASAQASVEVVTPPSEKQQGLVARPLAESGDAIAQWMVGQGLLMPPDADPTVAFTWILRAADQGHGLAQRDLGRLYEAGWGVKQDFQEAYFWYSLAPMHDSGRAAVRRNEIATGLTREQLDTAERRLQLWRSRKESTATGN